MLLHVRKENNEQTMDDSNEENLTHKFFDNHYSWLWNLMAPRSSLIFSLLQP